MLRRRGLRVMLFLVLVGTALVWAQGAAPSVAFVNSSGQLVVASGDGLARWIVANPGETLAQPLGFTWSPDGRRVFFAVNAGGAASLRVGDVASQSVAEIGQASGALSGGQWTPDGRSVLVGADNALLAFPADGGGPAVLQQFGSQVRLISPYANDRPNLPAAQSLSPDGQFVFFWLRGHTAAGGQRPRRAPERVVGGLRSGGSILGFRRRQQRAWRDSRGQRPDRHAQQRARHAD